MIMEWHVTLAVLLGVVLAGLLLLLAKVLCWIVERKAKREKAEIEHKGMIGEVREAGQMRMRAQMESETEASTERDEQMVEFCMDEQIQRIVTGITHQAGLWRRYAGFLGLATTPICTGLTGGFIFRFEGILFKLYVKGFFGMDEPKPLPKYRRPVLENDEAFESLIYATQVREQSRDTHILYVDWRVVGRLKVFLDELTATVDDLRVQAVLAAAKAKEDGQIFTLFEDEEGARLTSEIVSTGKAVGAIIEVESKPEDEEDGE